MFFLTGVARYLFVPMAEAVVFAMLASYVLSRTLVPTMAKYLLMRAPAGHAAGAPAAIPSAGCSARSTTASCACARRIRARSSAVSTRRGLFAAPSCAFCVVSFAAAARCSGRTSSRRRRGPDQAAHARADRHAHRGDGAPLRPGRAGDPRDRSRRRSSTSILDNIGLPYSGLNLSYTNSAPIGPQDADILVSLNDGSPADRRVRARSADRAERALSRRRSSSSSRRHRQPDPELRPAGADRRADRRPQHRGEPPVRGDAARPAAARSRDRRPARAPGREPAGARAGRRSHARRAGRAHAARRREQPARSR